MNAGQKFLTKVLSNGPEKDAVLRSDHRIKFCPQCKKEYRAFYDTKERAMKMGNAETREQWLSGICSDKCWNIYLCLPSDNDL